VPFEDAPELAVGQQLGVVDHTGGAEHRIEQRGGMSLGEDQPVVRRVLRAVEVVAEMVREQHGHQVGGRHARRRVARLRRRRRPDRVHPQLLAEFAKLLLVHADRLPSARYRKLEAPF